jgi:hypothetical protein
MPNRILREGILTSEPVAGLSWAEEVFYRRLQSIVDDYGRYEASAQLLRSKCYPLHTDAQVKAAQVWKWLEACANAGLVIVYSCAGKTYLEVCKFGQQQRTKSKYPSPPAIDSKCTDTNGNEHLGVFVFGVVSVVGGGIGAAQPTTPPKAKKTQMPKDFGISARVRAWAKEKGFGQLEKHLESFRSKVAAKGYTYIDWDEGFMGAIREDWAKLRGRTANGSAPPPDGADGEWHDRQSGVEARAKELGIEAWNPVDEQYPTYKARVMAAHQAEAH